MGKFVIVSGSPAEFSRSAAIAKFVGELLAENNEVEFIQVKDLPPEDLVYAKWDSEAIKKSISLIESADALVVISPVYKASYTGLLKTFIDLLPEKSLVNKTILPILNGGTVAHLLSLEYAFKPVFSVLGATDIVNGVYLVDSQVQYRETEITFIESGAEQRLRSNVSELISRVNNQPKLLIKG